MYGRIEDQQIEDEFYGVRGTLTMLGLSLLLLVAAGLLIVLGGWLLLGAYIFGLWGLAGLAKGVVELARLLRSPRAVAAIAGGEEVGDVQAHPGRL